MGMILGKACGLDRYALKEIATAGILHDLGKTEIPDSILNKPGKLTDDEFKQIKLHPYFGYQKLKGDKNISSAIKYRVLHHHENYDGTGYPLKLKGDKIHLYGRILSIVDVYDALVTERPYKKAFSPSEAYEMLMGMSNKFDLELFNKFSNCVVLYPRGSIVKINNKDFMILEQNIGYPLRPIVKDMETNINYNLIDINCLSMIIS